jgi:peptide/nickel transport system permease protein/oligopeptide transport system permease protein
MKIGILLFSIILLSSGIIISALSTITKQCELVNYGYGSVANPPQYWREELWSVLNKGMPSAYIVLNGTRIVNLGNVSSVQLNSSYFYVYVIKGYVQPYAYLSPIGLLLIFLGTATGFRGMILLIQERALGELSKGYAVGGSIYKYVIKRLTSFVISMMIVSSVVIILEAIHGVCITKSIFELITFSMGYSRHYGISVTSLLLTSLAFTSLLTGIAFALTVYLSPFLVMKAILGSSVINSLLRRWKYIGNALASWVIAIGLIYLFHVYLNVLPIGSPKGHLIYYLILPLVSLFFPFIGIFANRILLSVSKVPQEFIAKGLSRDVLVFRHILGNLTVVTLSSISAAFVEMLIAEFLVEAIFAWPGLGYLIRIGVDYDDFKIVEGVLMIYSSIVIFSNFIADVIYGIIDPRVTR